MNYRVGMLWALSLTFVVVTYSTGVWISSDSILSTGIEQATTTAKADVFAFGGLAMIGIWCVCGIAYVIADAFLSSVFGIQTPMSRMDGDLGPPLAPYPRHMT